MNESINNMRTKFIPKRINCWKTYRARADMVVLEKNVGATWRVRLCQKLGLEVSTRAHLLCERIDTKNAKAKIRKESNTYKKARAGHKRKRSGKEKKIHTTVAGVAGIYVSNAKTM